MKSTSRNNRLLQRFGLLWGDRMKLDFISAQNEILQLVKNPLFDLVNVDGMTNATSALSSVIIGGTDGDYVNNARAIPRGIILDLRIKNNVNVEDAKRTILNYIKLKQKGTLQWEQNNKVLLITGIVEDIDMPRFSDSVTMQVTLHCDQPFWEDLNYIVQQIDDSIRLHYFTENPYDMLYFPVDGIPFGEYDMSRTRNFHNAGDVAVGLEIEIIAYKTVTNPIIYDTDGNFFGVGYGNGIKKVTMQAGDIIRITTHKRNKTVTMNGTSILGRIKPQSTWLQMKAGNNTFSIDSDDADVNNMTFSLIYKQRFV